MRARRQIISALLSLDESIRLAKLTIRTSGAIPNFLLTLNQKKTVAGVRGLIVARITQKNGFEWLEE
jgi:hypothetical protein